MRPARRGLDPYPNLLTDGPGHCAARQSTP